MKIEFEIMDPDPEEKIGLIHGPNRPMHCHDGFYSHTWDLTIDEGSPVLICHECEVCSWGLGEWLAEDPELLQMDPMRVKIQHHVEGQGDGIYTWMDVSPMFDD